MAKIVEMDESASILTQMEEHVGPVILIEKISVDPDEFDLFLNAWAAETEKFKEQPGFISTQLYKGIGGSGTFIIYAIWESAEHFKRAVNRVMDPQDRLSAFPPSTIASPHLFKWLFQASAWSNTLSHMILHLLSVLCVHTFLESLVTWGKER